MPVPPSKSGALSSRRECCGESDGGFEGWPLTDRDVTGGLQELQKKINRHFSILERRLSKLEKHVSQSSCQASLTPCVSKVGNPDIPDKSTAVTELSEKVHVLEQCVREFPILKEPTRSNHNPVSKPAQKISSTSLAVNAIQDHLHYCWRNTIWDLAVFVRTEQMNRGASVVVVVCVVFNVMLLIAFGAFVDMMITNKALLFDDESQKDFLYWRTTVAHDINFRNSITGASLASSVCNGHSYITMSNLQLQLVDDLRGYLNTVLGIPSGMLLCILSITVWYLVLVEELRSILGVCIASRSIAHGAFTRFEQDSADDYKVHIVSMSFRRRVLLNVILGFRTVVVVYLGWIGALFLLYELDLENMILNSIALQLMLNFDELMFALVPKIPGEVTNRIMPLKFPTKFRLWHEWGLFVALVSLYSAFACFIYLRYMNPYVDQLKDSLEALCEGSHDFVVAIDAIGIPWAAPTPPSSDNLPQEVYAQRAIARAMKFGFKEEQLQSTQRSNKGFFMQVASGDALQHMVERLPEFKSPTDWSMISLESADVVGWEKEFLVLGGRDFADEPDTVYNHYLQYLLKHEDNVSCAQVPLSYCSKHGRKAEHLVMRQLCPTHCGCASPTTGTVANTYGSASRSGFTGCAAWNARKKDFVDELEELPCADTKRREDFVSWSDGVGDAAHNSTTMLSNHILSLFDSGGCPEVALVMVGGTRICQETSLPAICPESCGCNTSQGWKAEHASRMDYCPHSCSSVNPLCMTIAVTHSTDTGERGPHVGIACAFPFKYKGVTYHTCTSQDWSGPWCAVTLLDGVSNQWGDCPDSFACVNASRIRDDLKDKFAVAGG